MGPESWPRPAAYNKRVRNEMNDETGLFFLHLPAGQAHETVYQYKLWD